MGPQPMNLRWVEEIELFLPCVTIVFLVSSTENYLLIKWMNHFTLCKYSVLFAINVLNKLLFLLYNIHREMDSLSSSLTQKYLLFHYLLNTTNILSALNNCPNITSWQGITYVSESSKQKRWLVHVNLKSNEMWACSTFQCLPIISHRVLDRQPTAVGPAHNTSRLHSFLLSICGRTQGCSSFLCLRHFSEVSLKPVSPKNW